MRPFVVSRFSRLFLAIVPLTLFLTMPRPSPAQTVTPISGNWVQASPANSPDPL